MEGDDNTKFYHKFANGCKVINTIWQLTNEQGETVNTFPRLATLATSHFKHIYKAPQTNTLAEVMCTAQLFPRFVNQDDSLELTKDVTLKELEATLILYPIFNRCSFMRNRSSLLERLSPPVLLFLQVG